MPKEQQKNATQMPKWLLYGLIVKGIVLILIVLAVLWYTGILG